MFSPARAGMDPSVTPPPIPDRCFPRTRGDGPASPFDLGIHSEFPPHARGWTLVGHVEQRSLRVSPARAGMDRPGRKERVMKISFPRTRGDGPCFVPTCLRGLDARFPRTRGDGPISVTGASDGDGQRVSPARAGMDLATWSLARSQSERLFPPHARGWTRPAIT